MSDYSFEKELSPAELAEIHHRYGIWTEPQREAVYDADLAVLDQQYDASARGDRDTPESLDWMSRGGESDDDEPVSGGDDPVSAQSDRPRDAWDDMNGNHTSFFISLDGVSPPELDEDEDAPGTWLDRKIAKDFRVGDFRPEVDRAMVFAAEPRRSAVFVRGPEDPKDEEIVEDVKTDQGAPGD